MKSIFPCICLAFALLVLVSCQSNASKKENDTNYQSFVRGLE